MTPARWVVVGAAGMLGRDVVSACSGRDVRALASDDLDVRDPDACRRAVRAADVVVNCAAWTAVDDAEQHEAAAFAVNAVGAANLARACAAQGSWLVHVSTDYVFGGVDGPQPRPYPEDAPLAPRSAYGRTKAAGEWAVAAHLPGRHHLVRTAWLYGGDGPSFVHVMRGLAGRGDAPVTVVADQYGQPTWTADVARVLLALVDAGAPSGPYHATSSGRATWYDLAREVFRLGGADPARVRPVPTSAYPRPAPRPTWSVLGHEAWADTGVTPIGPWEQRLAEYARTWRHGEEP